MTISYSAILWVMVGICFYAAITHLQIGLRRPIEHTHALFGLVSLCAGFATITNIELSSSHTPVEYLTGAHHSTFIVPLLFAIFPWFVQTYSSQRRRWIAAIISAGSFFVLVGSLTYPYTMMLATPPVLGTELTPWGEAITRSAVPATAFIKSVWVLYLAIIAYVIFSAWHLFRHGPPRRAFSFTIAMTPLVIALSINVLIGFGLLNFIFVGSFGLLLMIMLMSFSLSGEWRRSSKKMQVLLDNVPAVVYVKQLDGRYIFINHHFEQLHQRQASVVLGKTDAQLFEATRAGPQRAEKLALSKREPVESEESMLSSASTSDGSPDLRTYSSLHFPLVNANGEPYAICGISTDITERKAAADALQALAASLDRRVTRRTDQLANLNRELEAFAYSVSHDLRAPLTTVNGFADLLMREYAPKLDHTAQRYLNRIREGALRMGSLIQDLLNLSRVTQQTLQRQPIDLVTLANESFKSLHELDPTRQIAWVTPPTLPAYGDAALLSIVLNNLVNNAWKYTSKTPNARIELGSLEQGEIAFFVKDNGAGFDPKYADRLFRPFVRLHAEKDFPGTGIGLATVARIVSRHGGRIWVESTPDQGATFYFTLPVSEEDQEEKIAS